MVGSRRDLPSTTPMPVPAASTALAAPAVTKVSGFVNVPATLPTVSRTFEGPKNGSCTAGPGPIPQTPSVWPKSALWRGRFQSVATSNSPAPPRMVLAAKRWVVFHARLTLPCSTSFTAMPGSSRLLTKLCRLRLTLPGTYSV